MRSPNRVQPPTAAVLQRARRAKRAFCFPSSSSQQKPLGLFTALGCHTSEGFRLPFGPPSPQNRSVRACVTWIRSPNIKHNSGTWGCIAVVEPCACHVSHVTSWKPLRSFSLILSRWLFRMQQSPMTPEVSANLIPISGYWAALGLIGEPIRRLWFRVMVESVSGRGLVEGLFNSKAQKFAIYIERQEPVQRAFPPHLFHDQ